MAFKPNITGGGGGGAEGALLAINNLSDVPNDVVARQNIGAGTGDGDMLAANNLSEVDPAQARSNIGAGTGDGDMLAANNLSDVADPAQARANIGAGTGSGNGDMLAANNLSDVANPAVARANIGAGTGDLRSSQNLADLNDGAIARQNLGLGTAATENKGVNIGNVVTMANDGSGGATLPAVDARNLTNLTIPDIYLTKDNNLSDLTDPAQARANLGVGAGGGDLLAANNLSDLADISIAKQNLGTDFYANDEVLKFGNTTQSPNLTIGTDLNGIYGVQTIKFKNAGDGFVNHLQIGADDAIFNVFDPTYTTNQFPDTPGVILRSNTAGVHLGLFPKLGTANKSFMLSAPQGIRLVADTAGGPGILELGQGGSPSIITMASSSNSSNQIRAYSTVGPRIFMSGTLGIAMTGGNFGINMQVQTGINVKKTLVVDTDYEVQQSDYMVIMKSLSDFRTITLPKFGGSNESVSQTPVWIIKDETGIAANLPIRIIHADGAQIQGANVYNLNRNFGSVELYYAVESNEIHILNER